MSKIVYLGNFGNKFSDTTERHIKKAFEELGHEVVPIDEKNFNIDEILKHKGDLFFFHKGGTGMNVPMEALVDLLSQISYKKVFWYFDKVWNEREQWMDMVIPFVDMGFLTDETYVRRHKYKNLKVLRQGIGEWEYELKLPKKLKDEIAFIGSIYGDRQKFALAMKEVYGEKFKIYNNVFGKKLAELCQSVKIVVAPLFPSDDFYWSSRIYQVLGSGGFLIHPRLEGLKEEFEDGGHYVGYKNGIELRSAIDFFLDNKNSKVREKIRKQGHLKCIQEFTYKDRVKELLKQING